MDAGCGSTTPHPAQSTRRDQRRDPGRHYLRSGQYSLHGQRQFLHGWCANTTLRRTRSTGPARSALTARCDGRRRCAQRSGDHLPVVDVPDTLNTVRNRSTAVVDSDGDGGVRRRDQQHRLSSRTAPPGAAMPSSLPDSGFTPGQLTSPAPAAGRTVSDERPYQRGNSRAGCWIRNWSTCRSSTASGRSPGWATACGYLEGTAFPTRGGNSGITGHVYDADGNPGIFHDLKMLNMGCDEIRVHAYGQTYVYEVRSVDKYVNPDDTSGVYQHEDYPWLTLVTCREYDAASDTYDWRVVVRAVQTKDRVARMERPLYYGLKNKSPMIFLHRVFDFV